MFATSRGEASEFAMLVDWFTYPIDLRVSTNSLVEGVDADDFVEFECRVLGDPI